MCSNVEDSALVVNNTIFTDPSRYNLHYGTAFYKSFHLWHFRPNEGSLQDYCKSQHAEWVTDLQTSAQKIRYEFVLGDCNAICMNSPQWFQTFNVIDTSNVCDHVGLLGLLLVQTFGCATRDYIYNIDDLKMGTLPLSQDGAGRRQRKMGRYLWLQLSR